MAQGGVRDGDVGCGGDRVVEWVFSDSSHSYRVSQDRDILVSDIDKAPNWTCFLHSVDISPAHMTMQNIYTHRH